MSLLSKLFRTADERSLDEKHEASLKKFTRQLNPVLAVGMAILLPAERCRDVIIPWVSASDEKSRKRMEIFAHYEFVYFFTHLTLRLAFGMMTEAERAHKKTNRGFSCKPSEG